MRNKDSIAVTASVPFGALVDGSFGGAAFDVFSEEPPTDMELLNLPNFAATPHIRGSCEEAILAMGRAAIEGLDSASLPEELPEVRELGR
jgi:phosphoglycerate dehydrogenase-like enzyme